MAMLALSDNLVWMRAQEANSKDVIICDGPYGLAFMGEDWDSFSVEKDRKSAGGFGKDSPTNENAYAAAQVRYGALGKHFTERPAKDALKAEGSNRATDGALPIYSGGMLYQRFTETWAREAFRILKPGGYLLSFSAPKTYHRMACGIEDAGFEIRDQIDWIYGSGFPKSQNVRRSMDMRACRAAGTEGRHFESKLPKALEPGERPKKGTNYLQEGDHICGTFPEFEEWEGYGTALKPAHEPICMARKPLSEGTVALNVQKHGTGALNIPGCEVGRDADDVPGWHKSGADGTNGFRDSNTFRTRSMGADEIRERRGEKGRWPANLIFGHLEGCKPAGESRVRVAYSDKGTLKADGFNPGKPHVGEGGRKINKPCDSEGMETVTVWECEEDCPVRELESQEAGKARFFYTAKPSKRERDTGLDAFEEKAWVQWQTANGTSGSASSISAGRNTKKKNNHPTCKPVALMRYLIRLVTPRGGTVLDIFMGSGTTGVAAIEEGFKFEGIENNPAYLDIAKARIGHAELRESVRIDCETITRENVKREIARMQTRAPRIPVRRAR